MPLPPERLSALVPPLLSPTLATFQTAGAFPRLSGPGNDRPNDSKNVIDYNNVYILDSVYDVTSDAFYGESCSSAVCRTCHLAL
jgi:hypothetical protein